MRRSWDCLTRTIPLRWIPAPTPILSTTAPDTALPSGPFWSRKQNLFNFARQCSKSIGDLDMQLDFLWKELTEGYASLVRTLQSAATIRIASDAVLVQFERPADQSETAKARRASYGQKYFDQYAGKGETMPSTNAVSAVERLLATARAEIGYIEKETNAQLDDKTANAGDNNWNKYARDLDALGIVYNFNKNGYAWCDIFTDWCFIHTFGLEMGMKLLCQAGERVGRWMHLFRQLLQAEGTVPHQ